MVATTDPAAGSITVTGFDAEYTRFFAESTKMAMGMHPAAMALNLATHAVFVACYLDSSGSEVVIDGTHNQIATTVGNLPGGMTSISVDPITNVSVSTSPSAIRTRLRPHTMPAASELFSSTILVTETSGLHSDRACSRWAVFIMWTSLRRGP
ncbi:hypothetical protein SBA7_560002 [Candidatus Sulfotelmatobacter sp. SbA7]|nr:hypothetical protein SBA7_560002 [Candidatus Sulfotelmatobacter sp. SbA7]